MAVVASVVRRPVRVGAVGRLQIPELHIERLACKARRRGICMLGLQALNIGDELPHVLRRKVVWRHGGASHAVADRLKQRQIARAMRELASDQGRRRSPVCGRTVALLAFPVKQDLAGTDVIVRGVGAADDGIRVRLIDEGRQPEARAGLEHRPQVGPAQIRQLASGFERRYAHAPVNLVVVVSRGGGEGENDENRDSQAQAGADTTHLR